MREYLGQIDELGELKRVEGADWHLEIGTLTELLVESRPSPATLFEGVPGFPAGYRILTNVLNSTSRLGLALGLPVGLREIELVKQWKDKIAAFEPIEPVEVSWGPVLENVHVGDHVDVGEFPAPLWHELDGGRYIGTGDVVIMRDPDEGWVNCGTYRAQVYDRSTLGVAIGEGKHGRLIRQKYFDKGLPCPAAISIGQDPALYLATTCDTAWGVAELDLAGWLKGQPIETTKGVTTGLPIPAFAEVVLEGEFLPTETRLEGPFGEWTGYYGSGPTEQPVFKVKSIAHRNDPIIFGQPPLRPPGEELYKFFFVAAAVWTELERVIPASSIKGVWQAPAGGCRFITVVSIKQLYAGHSRQAGYAVSTGRAGGFTGRFAIVVDDDIDPSNLDEVMWAVATRCDPATSIDILRGCWSGMLDPRIPPEQRRNGDFTNTRAVIDATRPFHWKDEYPVVNRASDELRRSAYEKWRGVLFT